MNIFIMGANGFIGSHLCAAILNQTPWHIVAIDRFDDRLKKYITHPHLQFFLGDINQHMDWIKTQMLRCDIIMPLAAIATPATYVHDPLRVFELDFEMNLQIIRLCAEYKKRLIFPSTSEVYGMCHDAVFDEESSYCVTGPIHKERWIYASSKQLLDRIIYAYGKRDGLDYCLFRPFNWYGPGLDDLEKSHRSRVVTQFIGHALRGEPISLVDGGLQKRCFTYIDDGIRALLAIIENKNQAAHQMIFNIGNPHENISIADLAEKILAYMAAHVKQSKQTRLVSVTGEDYYGSGYQDIHLRVPCIERAQQLLHWHPQIGLDEGLQKTIADCLIRYPMDACT